MSKENEDGARTIQEFLEEEGITVYLHIHDTFAEQDN